MKPMDHNHRAHALELESLQVLRPKPQVASPPQRGEATTMRDPHAPKKSEPLIAETRDQQGKPSAAKNKF